MKKRIFSIFMVIVMMTGMLPVTAFATNVHNETELDTGDITVSGTNGFGTLLSKEISSNQTISQDEYEAGYSVAGLTMDGNRAIVEYHSMETAVLMVALYSEDWMQLLASAHITVSPNEDIAYVDFGGEIPEYFQASAYLMDTYDLSPLCEAYTTPMYTKAMQELLNSTVEDYDENLVLNLDENTETNFAVYNEDTIVIEEQIGINTIVSADDETATYVIANADESITSLVAGDVFVYPHGESDILIVKIANISVNGTTVTITGEQELEMEEVFQAVKIEGASDTSDIIVDDSVADEGITYLGNGVSTYALGDPWEDEIPASISHTFSFEEKYQTESSGSKVSISGTLTIQLDVLLKYYFAWNTKYVELKVTPTISVSCEAEKEIPVFNKTLANLTVSVPECPFIKIGFKPELQIKFTGQASVELSFSMDLGFRYDDRGPHIIKTTPNVDLTPEIEGTFFIGIDFCPTAYIPLLDDNDGKDNSEINLVSVEATLLAGIEVKAKMSGQAYDDFERNTSSRHECLHCVDMALSFKWQIGATLELLGSDKEIPYEGNPIPLGKAYYSLDTSKFGFGSCPNLAYRVTVLVKDGILPMRNVTVTLNTLKDLESDVLSQVQITNYSGLAVFYTPAGNVTIIAETDDYYGWENLDVNTAGRVIVPLTYIGNDDPDSEEGTPPDSGETTPSDPEEDPKIELGGILGDVDTSELEDLGMPVASGNCGDSVIWTLYQNGLLKISGSGEIQQSTWYSYKESITSLVVENGITAIHNNIFSYCNNLNEVTIADSVTTIDSGAFRGCDNLTRVDLGNGLTSIELSTFYDCHNLTSVTLGDSLTTIGNYAFYNCSSLVGITIPDSVISVGSYAFYNCSSLSNAVIGNRVTTIGGSAFEKCSTLTSINIPDSVTTVGNHLFYNCQNLQYVKIGKGVSDITGGSFNGCLGLVAISVDSENTHFSSDNQGVLFDKHKTTLIKAPACGINGSYIIPNSVTTIIAGAFSGCSGLTEVTIPDSVTTMGEGTFKDCQCLTTVSIGNSLSAIEPNTFYNCRALTSIEIPDSVTAIGYNAFNDCQSLTNVAVGNGVLTIGDAAFYWCDKLTDVLLGNGVTTIGANAFYDCYSLTTINIPDTVASIGGNAFGQCRSLTSVIIPNRIEILEPGVFAGCSNLNSISIPNSVTSISGAALSNCSNLTNVTIPNSVTNIGDGAFRGCDNLIDITIPNSVTTIGNFAFADCQKLTSISIPDSVITMGDEVFDFCINLSTATIGNSVEVIGSSAFRDCKKLRCVTIGSSVTTIGSSAFNGCRNLTDIFLPDSITTIGRGAFNLCTNLTNVYYTGTLEQWSSIDIGSNNDFLINAYTGASNASIDSAEQDAPRSEMIESNSTAFTSGAESVVNAESDDSATPFAVYPGDYDTEENGGYLLKTASFTGLVPAQQYILLALKSITAGNPLSADNLLYISQAVALDDGTLTFQYIQDKSVTVSYVMACGASNKNLSNAQITFPEMFNNGELQVVEPTVVYDGKTLTEGKDYIVTGVVDYTEAGDYICYIRGIHQYTGLVECSYTVKKNDYAVLFDESSAVLTLTNLITDPVDAQLIAAAYDSNGRMILCQTIRQSLEGSESITLNLSGFLGSDVHQIKAFVLSADSLLPLRISKSWYISRVN